MSAIEHGSDLHLECILREAEDLFVGGEAHIGIWSPGFPGNSPVNVLLLRKTLFGTFRAIGFGLIHCIFPSVTEAHQRQRKESQGENSISFSAQEI